MEQFWRHFECETIETIGKLMNFAIFGFHVELHGKCSF